MKRYLYFIILVIDVLFMPGCKKKSVEPSADVYIAGVEDYKAIYWKNGVATILNNLNSTAVAITVVGNDVYVAGSVPAPDGKSTVPVYWKNGVINYLGKGQASGIAVIGNDVYVAGSGSYGISSAICWKNGVADTLAKNAAAYGITSSGENIYIAGVVGDTATYWKNNVPISLGNGQGNAITVQGNDVYVAGYSYNNLGNFGCYWKNGNINTLQANTWVDDIKASGNDVYMAGTNLIQGNTYACYWKNGNLTMYDEFTSAYKLALANNDVYLVGSYTIGSKQGALVWKNNVLTSLSGNSLFSGAFNIFIVTH